MPQPLRNCSHQAKPKKAASGAHPEKQSPSRFCVQAIAGVQPQKSRNVAFGPPKNNEKQNNENVLLLEPLKTMKSCPSHCEVAFRTPKNNEIVPQPLRNCSHQAKHKKAASGAHPEKQSPSRFCVQAIAGVQPQKSRNVAFGTPKNNEKQNNENVLLLEPGAHPEKQSPSRFCVQAIAGVQPQKSRNVAFGTPKNNEKKNNENVLLLEPLKTMKSYPSHCETAATKQSPRKLRRERIRKSRAPAGFASKPLQEYSLKNLETLLLEPLKTMKNNENVLLLEPLKTMKSCPSHCEVAFRTPKNNEIVPQPLRNCSHQAKHKKAASGAHPKKQSPSRFCVQAIAGVQPQKSQ